MGDGGWGHDVSCQAMRNNAEICPRYSRSSLGVRRPELPWTGHYRLLAATCWSGVTVLAARHRTEIPADVRP